MRSCQHLTRQSDDFQTAAGIHRSLSELYRNLAQNRIFPRRAAVLAYISNLMLRTLPAVDFERPAQRSRAGLTCGAPPALAEGSTEWGGKDTGSGDSTGKATSISIVPCGAIRLRRSMG